jgi:hypothetical protein
MTKTLYKFLRTGLKSDNGENRDWVIGEWREEKGGLGICSRGFHASKTPLQALSYVSGEILAKVEVRGESIIQENQECWSEMRIVKAWHWKKEDSMALAIFAAEQVIDIFEKEYPNNKRPREAIEAAKAYLKEPTEANRKKTADAAYAANAVANATYVVTYMVTYLENATRVTEYAVAYVMYTPDKLRAKIDKWFTKHIKTLEAWKK